MLSKRTYREVVRKLDGFRKQHVQDRLDHPDRFPIDWASSIRSMIERTVRDNREQCPKGTADETLAYLIKQGLLVAYLGGATFPGEKLPTEADVRDKMGSKIPTT